MSVLKGGSRVFEDEVRNILLYNIIFTFIISLLDSSRRGRVDFGKPRMLRLPAAILRCGSIGSNFYGRQACCTFHNFLRCDLSLVASS